MADQYVFRKGVDREVSLMVCFNVDDIVVTMKDKHIFDGF